MSQFLSGLFNIYGHQEQLIHRINISDKIHKNLCSTNNNETIESIFNFNKSTNEMIFIH